ncbi:MAG: hypothetical protein ACLTTP_03670 [Alistipes ihumii]
MEEQQRDHAERNGNLPLRLHVPRAESSTGKEDEPGRHEVESPQHGRFGSGLPPDGDKNGKQQRIEDRQQIEQVLGHERKLKIFVASGQMIAERNPVVPGLPSQMRKDQQQRHDAGGVEFRIAQQAQVRQHGQQHDQRADTYCTRARHSDAEPQGMAPAVVSVRRL